MQNLTPEVCADGHFKGTPEYLAFAKDFPDGRIACRAWEAIQKQKRMQDLREAVRADIASFRVASPPTEADKNNSRALTKRAVYCGILSPTTCDCCGSVYSEVHHRNYADPLDVEWLCRRCHMREHRAPRPPVQDAIDLAIKIAKSETRGRNYRDDVIGDALLVVAEGERTREGIERACRRSIRREWTRAKRFVSKDADEASGNAKHEELWEALRALPPKHYQAISLHFWGGLTQVEVAREMRVSQPFACRLIAEAKEKLRNLLSEVIKMPISMPLVGESE